MDQRTRMESEVKRWQESGLSQRAFCELSGIKLTTFTYWAYKRIARDQQQSNKGFVPLHPPGQASQTVPEGLLEIIYPNGVRVKAGSADLKTITNLISLYSGCSR